MTSICLLWQMDNLQPKKNDHDIYEAVVYGLSKFRETFKIEPTAIEVNPDIRKTVFEKEKEIDHIPLVPDSTVFSNQVRYCFDESLESVVDEIRRNRNIQIP